MPHPRNRFILPSVVKKLKYTPVLAIQGARQTGKSFFVRELLSNKISSARYITFDQDSAKEFARNDIESFMAKYEGEHPLIIDEAQKVPAVFDAVKYAVDKNRIPGSFILLGSTEFSKLLQIRESLTGRVSKVRFFPLTLREAHQLEAGNSSLPFYLSEHAKINRKALLDHLEQGGLPGVFAVRSAEQKQEAIQDWLELTIHRDIHQFPKIKIESELCLKILRKIAELSEPSAGKVAKALRVDLRKIKTYLSVLETLFVITGISPLTGSTGKTLYYLFDVGIAHFLASDLQRQLETLFLQEYMAKRSFSGKSRIERQIYYYRTSHGSRISFVEENKNALYAIQIFARQPKKKIDFSILEAFYAHFSKKNKVGIFAFVPNLNVPSPKHCKCYLWEQVG